MIDILSESLFIKQGKMFERVNDISRGFSANYCGQVIPRESIFRITSNFAKKRGISLEVLRYPFGDEELWAFTFVKQGRVFLGVNSELPMCKQIFAVAHELYHIHCYVEDINTNTIANGSLLKSENFDAAFASQEDLEANAFAGLLLMPDSSIFEQVRLYGIPRDNIDIDHVLLLMEIYALPYKAVVLRLVESGLIKEDVARSLLQIDADYVSKRLSLTGIASQWQRNTIGEEFYGSLLENMEYNSSHELLRLSRENSDYETLAEIRKGFCIEK